jgi:hypothetical protein
MNLRSLTLITALLAVASASYAADLRIAGNTTGSSFTFIQNAGGLSYESGVFDTTTINGAYSLGSADVTDNSLGRFVLSNTLGDYSGSFNLLVNFTSPLGISPSSTATYTAVLSGTLTATGSSVRVDFDNTPQFFTFTDGVQMGTFSLQVEDINLGRPRTGDTIVSVSGFGEGNVTAVPGPSALAAFGIGAIANMRRRRRSA